MKKEKKESEKRKTEKREPSVFRRWYDSGKKMGEQKYDKPIKGDYYEFGVSKGREEAEAILKDKSDYLDHASEEEKRGYAIGIAHSLMSKERSMDAVLLGAKVYEKLGEGDRCFVKRKLNKALERLKNEAEKKKSVKPAYESYKEEVGAFLDRNKKEGGLEKKATFLSLLFFVLGIFFLSPNLTGNAIAGLGVGSANWIGGAFILIGLIVGFLVLRKI